MNADNQYFLKRVKFKTFLKYMGYVDPKLTNKNLCRILYRRSFWECSESVLEGVIIGENRYYEGTHIDKAPYSKDDIYNQNVLENKKAVQVFRISVGFNIIYEVEKNYLKTLNKFGKPKRNKNCYKSDEDFRC